MPGQGPAGSATVNSWTREKPYRSYTRTSEPSSPAQQSTRIRPSWSSAIRIPPPRAMSPMSASRSWLPVHGAVPHCWVLPRAFIHVTASSPSASTAAMSPGPPGRILMTPF